MFFETQCTTISRRWRAELAGEDTGQGADKDELDDDDATAR